jgi:hypothetical protein
MFVTNCLFNIGGNGYGYVVVADFQPNLQTKEIGGIIMYEAPYCWCCGKKEHFNGYGCNNPECKEYYKLKELKLGAKTSNNKLKPNIEA